MKMKILDYTLLTLLSGSAPLAWAQAQPVGPAPKAPAEAAAKETACTETGCRSDEGLLFQLQTRGKRAPLTRGTTEKSSSEELQPDRRVFIELQDPDKPVLADKPQPGKAVATGKF